TANLQQGQTRQLTAPREDASGNALAGRVVTWASGNTAVATVSGSGLVSGVAAGSAAITATSEGKSGSASITVTPVGATVTLVGAGDIAECGDATDDSTAALLGRIGAPSSRRAITPTRTATTRTTRIAGRPHGGG